MTTINRAEIDTAGKELIRDYRSGRISKDAAFVGLIGLIALPITNCLRLKYGVVRKHTLDDLFQTFLLRFYEIEPTYDLSRELLPFLWTIARNIKVDYLRKMSQEGLRDEVIFGFEWKQYNAAKGRVEHHEHTVMLEEALSTLSEVDREIILLYFGYEHTLIEVAELVGLPRSTVQGRIRSARRQVKGYFEPKHKPSLGKIVRPPEGPAPGDRLRGEAL